MVSPVFAGRDAELAVLAAAFGEAAGGTPGTGGRWTGFVTRAGARQTPAEVPEGL